MTENKPKGSDLAKVDAHIITQEEYDEIPELTEEDFARGVFKIGDRVVGIDGVSRGRHERDRPSKRPSRTL